MIILIPCIASVFLCLIGFIICKKDKPFFFRMFCVFRLVYDIVFDTYNTEGKESIREKKEMILIKNKQK